MSLVARPIEDVVVTQAVGEGFTITQSWIVDGLTGQDGVEKCYTALQAAGLPRAGDAYPSYIPGVLVRSVRASPAGVNASQAKVIVSSGAPDVINSIPNETSDGNIFVGISLQEFDTVYDEGGNQIITENTVTDSQGNSVVEELPGIVSALFPVMVLGTTRLESASPANKARAFAGKVNASFIWGEDARRWMCIRIEGDTDNEGDTYRVTYEFQRSPLFRFGVASSATYSGWDALVVHQKDGRPIKNPELGTSLKIVELYEEAEFGLLNLSGL